MAEGPISPDLLTEEKAVISRLEWPLLPLVDKLPHVRGPNVGIRMCPEPELIQIVQLSEKRRPQVTLALVSLRTF